MKEIIEYKGFKGSVHISTENNCLYGEVLGLPKNTKITYEGETVTELITDFRNSIDQYLSNCKVWENCIPWKDFVREVIVRLSYGPVPLSITGSRKVNIVSYEVNSLSGKLTFKTDGVFSTDINEYNYGKGEFTRLDLRSLKDITEEEKEYLKSEFDIDLEFDFYISDLDSMIALEDWFYKNNIDFKRIYKK